MGRLENWRPTLIAWEALRPHQGDQSNESLEDAPSAHPESQETEWLIVSRRGVGRAHVTHRNTVKYPTEVREELVNDPIVIGR
jgi:hypothetical protein